MLPRIGVRARLARPAGNSLLRELRDIADSPRQSFIKHPLIQWLDLEFPVQGNRESIRAHQGLNSGISGN